MLSKIPDTTPFTLSPSIIIFSKALPKPLSNASIPSLVISLKVVIVVSACINHVAQYNSFSVRLLTVWSRCICNSSSFIRASDSVINALRCSCDNTVFSFIISRRLSWLLRINPSSFINLSINLSASSCCLLKSSIALLWLVNNALYVLSCARISASNAFALSCAAFFVASVLAFSSLIACLNLNISSISASSVMPFNFNNSFSWFVATKNCSFNDFINFSPILNDCLSKSIVLFLKALNSANALLLSRMLSAKFLNDLLGFSCAPKIPSNSLVADIAAPSSPAFNFANASSNLCTSSTDMPYVFAVFANLLLYCRKRDFSNFLSIFSAASPKLCASGVSLSKSLIKFFTALR